MKSNAYQYFFAYKNIVKRFNTTKIAAFVNSGGHIGLRNSF